MYCACIELSTKGVTFTLLYLVHIDAWCGNKDTFEKKPAETENIRDVVSKENIIHEKDRACHVWRSDQNGTVQT